MCKWNANPDNTTCNCNSSEKGSTSFAPHYISPQPSCKNTFWGNESLNAHRSSHHFSKESYFLS